MVKNPFSIKRRSKETAEEFSCGAVLGGTYRLLQPLGPGGQGRLFLASHERMPGHFVVKGLPPEGHSDESIDGLRHEAIVMGTIHHSNVIQMMDFDLTERGQPYLVMEFLPGENLTQIVTRAPLLPLARVASIVRQVAYGLEAAHRVGVVHQDLNPSSIMLMPREEDWDLVKLIDFGFSKPAQPINLNPEGGWERTARFIAPEQIEGGEVGPLSDQFSLAVTCYVLLTGRLPWRGSTALSLLYSIVNRDPIPFSDGSLQSVEPVLRRGMAKDPPSRFASVMAFWQALFRALTTDGVVSEPAYPLTPLGLGGTKPFGIRSVPPLRTRASASPRLAVPLITHPMEEEASMTTKDFVGTAPRELMEWQRWHH